MNRVVKNSIAPKYSKFCKTNDYQHRNQYKWKWSAQAHAIFYYPMKSSFLKKGVSLVEVIIAVSIISLGFVVVAQAYVTLVKVSLANTKKIQGALIAEEGMEAIRGIRDISWSSKIANLSVNTKYYFAFSTTTNLWTSTSTLGYVDGTFARSFTLQNVYRNGSSNIASSGTLDPNIKKVVVSVAWQDKSATTTKTISTYLTNILAN